MEGGYRVACVAAGATVMCSRRPGLCRVLNGMYRRLGGSGGLELRGAHRDQPVARMPTCKLVVIFQCVDLSFVELVFLPEYFVVVAAVVLLSITMHGV